MGHPCLLTSQWEAVPLAELVNLVGAYVNPNLYYVVTDCCANDRTSTDEATLKRADPPRYCGPRGQRTRNPPGHRHRGQ